MALSARIGDAREGGRKPQMPQQPAASRPGAVPHVLLPGVRAGTGAQGGAQAPAGAPLQHTALRKTTSEEVCAFFNPKTHPEGALRAQFGTEAPMRDWPEKPSLEPKTSGQTYL